MPALNALPLPRPTISRPANSHAAPCVPAMSTPLPITEVMSANSTTGRRPIRSDSEPPTSRPGTSPIAYSANMASTTGADSPSLSRYSSRSGVNWLVPHPIMQAASPAPSQRGAARGGEGSHDRLTAESWEIVIV